MLTVSGFSTQLFWSKCLKVTNFFLDSIYHRLIYDCTNVGGKWLCHSTGINISQIYAQMYKYLKYPQIPREERCSVVPSATYFYAMGPQRGSHSSSATLSVIWRITYHFSTAVSAGCSSVSLSICFSLIRVCEGRSCSILVLPASLLSTSISLYIIVLPLYLVCIEKKYLFS